MWPLEWFCNGRYEYLGLIPGDDEDEDEDRDESERARVKWNHLGLMGWDSSYLDSLEIEDLPQSPGIYVVVHEWEAPALYVGQSLNLNRRLKEDRHHKIPLLVDMWESAPMGYHNRGNARSEMRVFWKCVKPPFYNGSCERMLLWCESIAIGLLCPIAQGKITDIKEQDWARGRQWY